MKRHNRLMHRVEWESIRDKSVIGPNAAFALASPGDAVGVVSWDAPYTTDDVKAIIGEVPALAGDYEDLAAQMGADPGEGAEMLPRYKLALSLLAHMAGLQSGTLEKLRTAYGDSDAGRALAGIMDQCEAIWKAHLLCLVMKDSKGGGS